MDQVTLPRAVAQQVLEALLAAWQHNPHWQTNEAITAAQQALEFVTSKQWGTTPYMDVRVYEDAARLRDTLRAALEQPEPPPEAQTEAEKIAYCAGWWAAMEQKREQPEQEPVANNPDPYHLSRILHELAGSASMCWEHVDRAGVFQATQAADVVAAAIAEIRQRMKDAPPRREWRSLSEEEIKALSNDCYDGGHTNPMILFARAVEAALRSKNYE